MQSETPAFLTEDSFAVFHLGWCLNKDYLAVSVPVIGDCYLVLTTTVMTTHLHTSLITI